MAVELKDIRVWAVKDGVSHVVAEQTSAGTLTACNSLLWGDWRRKTRTKRICQKCRDRLKEATLRGDAS